MACGLGNIQKIRDGEPLGGKTSAVDDLLLMWMKTSFPKITTLWAAGYYFAAHFYIRRGI